MFDSKTLLRFQTKLNPLDQFSPDSCWEWQAYRNPQGYGYFKVVSRETPWQAHRFMWVANHGPIPPGMFVCHHCDNPACTNPSHLFLGTQRDNLVDMTIKGRRRNGTEGQTHCKRGHEFTPENTCLHRGKRSCRTCKNTAERDLYHRIKGQRAS